MLGGGVSGLTAAWNLAKRAVAGSGREVVLVEASERVGGWMRSEKAPSGGVLELGPRSLRTAGRAGKVTLALVRPWSRCDPPVLVPRTLSLDVQKHEVP